MLFLLFIHYFYLVHFELLVMFYIYVLIYGLISYSKALKSYFYFVLFL